MTVYWFNARGGGGESDSLLVGENLTEGEGDLTEGVGVGENLTVYWFK